MALDPGDKLTGDVEQSGDQFTSGRPYSSPPTTLTDTYVGDWSSDGGVPGLPDDTLGDGTINSPYATYIRALRTIGTNNGSTKNIRFAGGVHDLPAVLSENNWINVLGLEVDGSIATQTGAAVQADEAGIIIDVTGITTTGVDELRGTLFQWTSGSPNNRRGWITHCDITGTTAGGVTRLTVTQEGETALKIPADTNTLKMITLSTTLRIPSFFTLFQSSVQFNLKQLILSDTTGGGGFVMFPVDTDKIGCEDVFFDLNRIQVGRFGGLEMLNCYGAFTGHAVRGSIAITRGGDLQLLRGTVIDCDLNATVDANRFIELTAGGKLSYDGNCTLIGLNTLGICCDNAEITAQGPITSRHALIFDDCDGGYVLNSLGIGTGGNYFLPNLFGTINAGGHEYAVVAQDGAHVKIGGTSSVSTPNGVNAVSVKNIVSGTYDGESVGADGSIISGGSPDVGEGFSRAWRQTFVNADLTAGVLTVNHGLGSKFVTVQVYNDVDVGIDEDTLTVNSASELELDLSTQGALSGTWNLVVVG